MNWTSYLQQFDDILSAENPHPPYDDSFYFDYVKMNYTRMKRWMKKSHITDENADIIRAIDQPQTWIVITEPWCGDAAHIVPILEQLSALNNLVTFKIQLRDSGSDIDSYLTGTTKSIPILVVRDALGNDIFVWGPRPQPGTELYNSLKESGAEFEEIKLALQNFYNADKSISTQNEVAGLIKAHHRANKKVTLAG